MAISIRRSLALAFTALACAQSVQSQTILERWYGDFDTQFGRSVRAAGDVDGDGTRDVLITSIDRVEVFSGATHAPVRSFTAPAADIGFGYSADASGDVDNDGYSDVIVGAPFNDFLGSDSGSAWVYSGRTGQPIWIYHGLVPQDHTGWQVGFVGDLDGDAHDDFALSTPYAAGSGQVRVYAGANGVLANVIETYAPGFGTSFELVADYDGDGLGELAVLERPLCCPYGSATLYVFSLPSANALLAFSLDGISSYADASDVDVDGVPDLVVSCTRAANNVPLFNLVSGATGAVLADAPFTINCCNQRVQVTRVADLDGDGLAQEFAVGWPTDPFSGTESVYVFRGAEQVAWLYPVGASQPSSFGASVAVIPDTNGDGFDEVLVGAPSSGSATTLPQAWLMSAFSLPAQSYCTAKVNSLGCTPEIDATGFPDLNGPYAFVPEARNVINQKAGLFVWSAGSQAVPFQGGTLCVAAPIRRSSGLNSGGSASGSDCSGRLVFNITPMFMWLQGWQVGDEFFGQFWYRDPAHVDGTGVGLSDALSFRVGL